MAHSPDPLLVHLNVVVRLSDTPTSHRQHDGVFSTPIQIWFGFAHRVRYRFRSHFPPNSGTMMGCPNPVSDSSEKAPWDFHNGVPSALGIQANRSTLSILSPWRDSNNSTRSFQKSTNGVIVRAIPHIRNVFKREGLRAIFSDCNRPMNGSQSGF